MTELSVSLVGAEKLLDKLKSVADKIDEKVFEVVKNTTIKVNSTAINSMKTGGGGLGKGKTPHRSRPGNPPYVQTGYLKSNVTFELPTLIKGRKIIGKVGVKDIVPYARALEYGYPPRNLKERPFLRPALAKHIPQFEKELSDIIGVIK